MTAVELALEKVKRLDEVHARHLLHWLQGQELAVRTQPTSASARTMLGFARRFRNQARSTADWMSELRDGERD